jgi:hypothetical protein
VSSRVARIVLAASVVAVLVGVSAGGAMASKVYLTEKGKGVPQGEATLIVTYISFAGAGECEGIDVGGSLGKNPSGKLKVAGSNKGIASLICVNDEAEVANGGQIVKSVAVAATGQVTLSLSATIEAASGCKYEVKKLTGTQSFGGPFGESLSGTAKIQKGTGSPKSCPKSTSVTGWSYVQTSTGQPTVNLI